MGYYHKRDQAFLSLMYVAGLRVNEVLRILKSQFDFESNPKFIIIKDVEISKRKKKLIKTKGVPKIDVWLPLEGELAPFTILVEQYYRISETDRLFPFGTKRAWAITKHITGKWCHYFRAQRISDLINRQKVRLLPAAKIVGIKDPTTIAHYDKGTPEEHQKELSR